MSLLLALTGGGGSGVTGALESSQAQTTSANGSAAPAAVDGSLSTSQAQTIAASGVFSPAVGVNGTIATSQAQTVAGSGAASPATVTGILASSQAQTSALTGNASPAAVSGTAVSSQAQTSAISGSFAGSAGVSGVVSSSQGQTSVASGSVSGGGDQIPFWLTWHLYDWVQKKKKHDDEVSLKEVAQNIVELIEEKPKAKLSKQFKAAIERQQDIEKQRISTENAYSYIKDLINTRAAYERKKIIEEELQAQFDIDEEEAILLLL
jgi:hypothetical protein